MDTFLSPKYKAERQIEMHLVHMHIRCILRVMTHSGYTGLDGQSLAPEIIIGTL